MCFPAARKLWSEYLLRISLPAGACAEDAEILHGALFFLQAPRRPASGSQWTHPSGAGCTSNTLRKRWGHSRGHGWVRRCASRSKAPGLTPTCSSSQVEKWSRVNLLGLLHPHTRVAPYSVTTIYCDCRRRCCSFSPHLAISTVTEYDSAYCILWPLCNL